MYLHSKTNPWCRKKGENDEKTVSSYARCNTFATLPYNWLYPGYGSWLSPPASAFNPN